MNFKTLTVGGLLLVSGCAVGPDYVQPEFGENAEWSERVESIDSSGALEVDWWRVFGDEKLDGYIAAALANNRELKAAVARVDAALAGRAAANGARLPSLLLDVRYTEFEQSIESPQSAGPLIRAGVIPRDGSFYNSSVLAGWELDLAGQLRRRAEAADATFGAQIEQADGVALQVAAETAGAYLDWQGFSARAAIARRNVALQSESLRVIAGKVQLGLSRRLDETRAQAELARLEATVPQLEAAAQAARQRLALLTGATASGLPKTVDGVIPQLPESVPVGTPADVLRRRPDVRAAERLLARSVAEVGAATAAFFPTLSLTASGGFEAAEFSTLGNGDARLFGIVPFVRWPIFQGGQLRAALDAADANQAAALADYEQAVLRALSDTESAVAAYDGARNAAQRLDEAVTAARESESLASKLYGQGLTDYLTLLDAQRQLAAIEDAELATTVTAAQSAITLYRALGGGWPAWQEAKR
ncbi:MAG: efflux transporter outer membrane subunit [Pseudomonadota bacterium]